MRVFFLFLLAFSISSLAFSQKKKKEEEKPTWASSDISALSFRNVGPAINSGRIADLVVNPMNYSEYYIAAASGGVWKTNNHGNTFRPIFDKYGSYSIGCLALDPNNPHVLWVGTGENNNQRSVAYGDGIYKSEDGGNSFKNVGLKNSEHIHKIIVHPTNSNIIYAAVAGPLWKEGGDRGIYLSKDGGKNWEEIFTVSEHTGITDLVMDPRNPNLLYAAAHQRRRHVHTYIGGGSESAIYKSTDGGKTWKKALKGLPSVDLGRIGLAIAPSNPDIIYAIVEASQGKGGFYRSTNRAANWSKQSDYSTSGNYYQEIYCDPLNSDLIYSMNTYLHHSEDGGKTFKRTGEKHKHVDNHAMWINPNDTKHWLVGCDGGLYETWDAALNWHYKPNLPLTQFYKVAVDNTKPFYHIYGGTQDNNSMGGPSQTFNKAGILNSDWYITNGGDGFESAIDPVDPNIVYAQSQYGGLVRYDKKSGEKVRIQPKPRPDEKPFRWNWDAPLLISPHNHKRLYFAANVLFKSEDRGISWERISNDLSRQRDRNKIKVMGRVQTADAVMKSMSTTIYGNCVAFDESPITEGLLYVGTDDGLMHISENGGTNWTKIEQFPNVPEFTYVNMIKASKHDENVVYACFNNHKEGDFKPYILKSADKGKTWKNISSNLPERGSVYALEQDHRSPDLLFAGTEFGLYCSLDEGKSWIQMKSGLPTIAIRDIAIQSDEDDLVLASFGRGFYVLDDYSLLRELTEDMKGMDANMFSIRTGQLYMETSPLGRSGKSQRGESFFTAKNPKYGVTFRYYIKESPQKAIDKRRKAEKELIKAGGNPVYPALEELRKEGKEEDSYLLLTIKDSDGDEIARIKEKEGKGIKRSTWNFRHASTNPWGEASKSDFSKQNSGNLCLPGSYSVSVSRINNGDVVQLIKDQKFEVEMMHRQSIPIEDQTQWMVFNEALQGLRKSVSGAVQLRNKTEDRVKHLKSAIQKTPGIPLELLGEIKQIELDFDEIDLMMNGDRLASRLQIETSPGIRSRMQTAIWGTFYNTSEPTSQNREQAKYAEIAYQDYDRKLDNLIIKVDVLEAKLTSLGAPYTPGSGKEWKDH